MKAIEDLLRRMADVQMDIPVVLFAAIMVVTAGLATGLTKIEMSSNLERELPDDLPSIIADNKISDSIGGADKVLVLMRLDLSQEGGAEDIRDPQSMRAVYNLHGKLESDNRIDDVSSIATVFGNGDIPETTEGVRSVLSRVNGSERMFDRKYVATIVQITANVPDSEQRIKEFTDRIEDSIEEVTMPSNMETSITGNAPVRATVLQFLREDMVYTTVIAGVMIFLFISLIRGSFKWAFTIFTPLIFALLWTLGTVSLIGMKITIATVFIGAMLLGMGVEFGAFMVERYREEIGENPSLDEVVEGINVAVPSVGSSIIGSSSTTIAGFFALAIATIPMVKELGIMLGLGIGYSLLAVLFIDPLLILGVEWLGIEVSGGDQS